MAKRFKKYMLSPGTYQDGSGKEVLVTRDRLGHFKTEFDKLTAANYTVPVHWDHGSEMHDVIPLSVADLRDRKKRSAANTVGVMSDFQLADYGAEITVDLFDNKAIEAAGANAVHVSPVILDQWSDGVSNKYSDVITHMDLVNLPSDNSQKPFEPSPGVVACSLRMGLEGKIAGNSGILMLAVDDDEDDEDEDEMAGDFDDFDDDDDDDDDLDAYADGGDFDISDDLEADLGTDDLTGLGDELDDMGDELDPVVDTTMDPQRDESLRQDIAADLSAVGLVPPNADPINDPVDWIKQLCASLKQKAIDDGDDQDESGEESLDDEFDTEIDDFDTEDVEVTEPDFATMSLDPKIVKVLSGAFDRVQQANARMQKRLAATEKTAHASRKRMVTMAREARADRINTLFADGRLTKPERDEKLAENQIVRMSLNTDGESKPTGLDVFLDSREALPKGAAWPADKRLTMATAYDPPEESLGEDMTPAKAKAINDKLAAEMPGSMRRLAAS